MPFPPLQSVRQPAEAPVLWSCRFNSAIFAEAYFGGEDYLMHPMLLYHPVNCLHFIVTVVETKACGRPLQEVVVLLQFTRSFL